MPVNTRDMSMYNDGARLRIVRANLHEVTPAARGIAVPTNST